MHFYQFHHHQTTCFMPKRYDFQLADFWITLKPSWKVELLSNTTRENAEKTDANNKYPKFVPEAGLESVQLWCKLGVQPSHCAPMNTPVHSLLLMSTTDLGYGRDGNQSWGHLRKLLVNWKAESLPHFHRRSRNSYRRSYCSRWYFVGTDWCVLQREEHFRTPRIHKRLNVRFIDLGNTDPQSRSKRSAIWMNLSPIQL